MIRMTKFLTVLLAFCGALQAAEPVDLVCSLTIGEGGIDVAVVDLHDLSEINLLAQLQEKHRLSYLFISHDLRVVRAMAHRVIVMRQGRVVEQGDVDEVFNNPKNEYTRELASASLYQ